MRMLDAGWPSGRFVLVNSLAYSISFGVFSLGLLGEFRADLAAATDVISLVVHLYLLTSYLCSPPKL